MKEKEA